MRKIVCTMNMPSPYQEAFYRELHKLCDLQVIYNEGLTPDRLQLGWETGDQSYNAVFRNQKAEISWDNDAFHFLIGFPGGLKNFIDIIKSARSHWYGCYSEMPVAENMSPQWKLAARTLAKFLKVKKGVVGGIGWQIREYYHSIGVPKSQVFPFAYFSAVTEVKELTQNPSYTSPLLYAGQLVHRKGIDILLHAMASSEAVRSRGLIIIGDGPQKEEYKSLAKTLGISDKVEFQGSKKGREIPSLIAGSSAFVLPSRHDGWGVVVNEAIHVGTPSIVSDVCGASELVQNGKCGAVFTSESASSLAAAFEKLYSSQETWQAASDNALRYSPLISPKAGAEYFLKIVEHSIARSGDRMPQAPWLTNPI